MVIIALERLRSYSNIKPEGVKDGINHSDQRGKVGHVAQTAVSTIPSGILFYESPRPLRLIYKKTDWDKVIAAAKSGDQIDITRARELAQKKGTLFRLAANAVLFNAER